MTFIQLFLLWCGVSAIIAIITLLFWYCQDNDIAIWPWDY